MQATRIVLEIHSPLHPVYRVVTTLPASLGRDPASTIPLTDAMVSATHAQLIDTPDGAFVHDAQSANGLWAGGLKVARVPLSKGTVFGIGETVFTVLATGPETSRTVAVRRLSEAVGGTAVVRLPAIAGSSGASTLVLRSVEVAAEHLLIEAAHEGLRITDLATAEQTPIADGSPLQIGDFVVEVASLWTRTPREADLTYVELGATQSQEEEEEDPPAQRFPPTTFTQAVVPLSEVLGSGLPVFDRPYLTLGGGLGSFAWVDALRVHGVAAATIHSVGFESKPYARYERLCTHSQIPLHERLRSNSESCPDNLWGFPGYGLREAWQDASSGDLAAALRTLGKLVGEPDHADTYTPRARDVFASIDAEAARIGWSRMHRQGRIRSVRKTDDGRYVVACSSMTDVPGGRALFLARTLHIALGYPGVQFLPDLRAFRARTRDFHHVVNAYEPHDHVYQQLEATGGVVALRGRGIVASRVLQRLHETRQKNPQIKVVHLMRAPHPRNGQRASAGRLVEHHWEYQPFNWPEACWGGTLADELLYAGPEQRGALLTTWGGTTTASRADWRAILAEGTSQGWYRIVFGVVQEVSKRGANIDLTVVANDGPQQVQADYIIDATGLVSSIDAHPLLADLCTTYDLPRNVRQGLDVNATFEVEGLRNGGGRAFACGVATLGSGYAPVDSFLGLQYSAAATLPVVEPRVRRLHALSSLNQWTRWLRGVAP